MRNSEYVKTVDVQAVLVYWMREMKEERGQEWHSVSWVLRKGSISEESSQLSLIFKCRVVSLKASRLTSLKTNAIFYFITVNSKAGFWRCSRSVGRNPAEQERDHRGL